MHLTKIFPENWHLRLIFSARAMILIKRNYRFCTQNTLMLNVFALEALEISKHCCVNNLLNEYIPEVQLIDRVYS